MMKCDRCGQITDSWTCSMFNEENICMDCKKKERQRSDYNLARDIEHEHVKNGDYNFKGIGLKDN